MTPAGRNPSPYGEGLLREAERALTRELEGMRPRRVVGLDEVMEEVRSRPGTIRWVLLAAWLRANPNVLFRLDKVRSNAVHKFKSRYPDITVIGMNHHYEEDGRRYAQMFAIYTPEKEQKP